MPSPWLTSLLVVVQRCPAVPTLAKSTDLTTISKSASSSTTMALLPPSSKIFLPNLSCTATPTLYPTWKKNVWIKFHTLRMSCAEIFVELILVCEDSLTGVLPVKDTKGTFLSLAMASPISAPPLTMLQMAAGSELATSTSSTILVMATWISGVEGAPFLLTSTISQECTGLNF